jgi:hypothetical protein
MDELATLCAAHRARAKQSPIGRLALADYKENPRRMERFTFRYGKFNVSIAYHTHRDKPFWHASVAILEDIAEQEFGAMQQALLAIESWTKEDHSQAQHILGEALGTVIYRPTQPVDVHDGLWAKHWCVPEDAPEEQPHEPRITLATH